MPSVAVFGASGFAGALAADLLWRHPSFELVTVTSRSDSGRRLDDLYPRYRVPLILEEPDVDAQAGVDAAIVAYPHAASAGLVAALRKRGVRVVDLSADFRLRDLGVYAEHYGQHPEPSLIQEAVYGLTELRREEIAGADLVANPGCFPTAALLALAPLARAGLIGDVVIDAKTGVSGAGRAATETTHFCSVDENVVAYKVGTHRHTPEIDQELSLMGSAAGPITFVPHLVPLDQGELVSCYVRGTEDVGADLDQIYATAYAQEPFIEIAQTPPGVRDVRDTNICRISVHRDQRSGLIVVFAAIDNLWKGTSSQAVANLNLMFGLPEGEGIS
ncbi:MAG: N-acetyl-gamma-glutamyl-phosphate reductase [Actinomycetota bacterium]